MKDNFSEIFSDRIIKDFMGDVKSKYIDDPLKSGELPKEFFVDKKFVIGEEFFKNDICKLPLMIKKLAGESEDIHLTRVRMYLFSCPDVKFNLIAELIDPENACHTGFYNLYNEVMEERIKNRSKQPEKESKNPCNIF